MEFINRCRTLMLAAAAAATRSIVKFTNELE